MQKKSLKKDRTVSKRIVIVSIAIFIVLIALDLLVGGSAKFYSTWIQCGRKPVVAAQSMAWGGGGVPHYYEPKSLELVRLHSEKYYCTEREAEQNYYSSNPHQYQYKYRGKQQ